MLQTVFTRETQPIDYLCKWIHYEELVQVVMEAERPPRHAVSEQGLRKAGGRAPVSD